MITTLSGHLSSRLGLAAVPDQDSHCVRQAFENGINYFFYYDSDNESFVVELAAILRTNRTDVIVATGSESRTARLLSAVKEKALAALDVEIIDVFFAEYINPSD